MSDYKTIADLANESGISQMRVRGILKDVIPAVKVGRSVGYHPDALRAALINKMGPELQYLGVYFAAADNLEGYGSQG
ncbi:MAG TPA: hypothetical protein VIY48_00045 [Candidatus Paceibacterota bacterium]